MSPSKMRYVSAIAAGGPEVLVTDTTDVPQPGADEVLIRVQAAGVFVRPQPRVVGIDGAGQPQFRGRQQGLRTDQRWRLCRVLRGAGNTMPALAK